MLAPPKHDPDTPMSDTAHVQAGDGDSERDPPRPGDRDCDRGEARARHLAPRAAAALQHGRTGGQWITLLTESHQFIFIERIERNACPLVVCSNKRVWVIGGDQLWSSQFYVTTSC